MDRRNGIARRTRHGARSTPATGAPTSYEEFLKGTAHGVAVRSDGRMELAPKFTLLADADASYLWSLRSDPKGVLVHRRGDRRQRFSASIRRARPPRYLNLPNFPRKPSRSIAKGNLYVGTSPDGKVYRVSASRGEIGLLRPQDEIHLGPGVFGRTARCMSQPATKGRFSRSTPDGKGELFYFE